MICKITKIIRLVLILAPCLVTAQSDDFFQITVSRIHPKAIVVSGTQFNTNQLIVKTSKGLILVDSGISPAYARELRKIASEEFDCDTFIYVINTHHHWDHVQGNQMFPDAVIIGHTQCGPAMIRQNSADRAAEITPQRINREGEQNQDVIPPPPPSHILIDGERTFQLTLPALSVDGSIFLSSGDVAVHIFSCGNWHTDNDLLVFFPDLGILASGDLFFKRSLPVFKTWSSLDADALVSLLDRILVSEKTVHSIIPGHNEMMTPADLILYRNYIHGLWQGIKRENGTGTTCKQILVSFSLAEKFPDLTERDILSSNGKSLHEGNIQNIWNYFNSTHK